MSETVRVRCLTCGHDQLLPREVANAARCSDCGAPTIINQTGPAKAPWHERINEHPATRQCPKCHEAMAGAATRCPHCTAKSNPPMNEATKQFMIWFVGIGLLLCLILPLIF